MKLLTLVLSLVINILQTCLGTQPCPFLSNQLARKLLVLLFNCTQGPVGFGTEVGLNPGFIPGVINPFLDNENFMDSLHISNKGICQKQDKRTAKEASKVCLGAYHGQIPFKG